jgi:hypothetical protein
MSDLNQVVERAAEAQSKSSHVVVMKRGGRTRKQDIIRPTGAVKRSPSTMVNDPSVIPSSALKVTVEHLLNGYDNDIEQISVEINSREARKADLERSREGCLALLSVLAREDSQQATPNED